MREVTVRSSKVPQALACPQSLVTPHVRIEGDDEPARLGTAVHKALEYMIEKGKAGEEGFSFADIADDFGVNREEMAMLAGMSWALWRNSLAQHFPTPQTEVKVEPLEAHGVRLTTTGIDVMCRAGGEVRVCDHKTGRIYPDHAEWQVKAYCRLLAQKFPDEQTFAGCVIHVRSSACEWFRWNRAELEEWWKSTCERILEGLEQNLYRPGAEQCQYCPRRFECPARRQEIVSHAGWLVDTRAEGALSAAPDAPLAVRGSSLAVMLQNARLVEKAAKDAIEAIRGDVKAHGGALPMLDGRHLVLKEEKHRKVQNTHRGGDGSPEILPFRGSNPHALFPTARRRSRTNWAPWRRRVARAS